MFYLTFAITQSKFATRTLEASDVFRSIILKNIKLNFELHQKVLDANISRENMSTT